MLFFEANDFVVAIAVVSALVVKCEYVDFVALAPSIDVGAIHASFFEFVPAVAKISVVVPDENLKWLGQFLLRIKNQTLSIEFP